MRLRQRDVPPFNHRHSLAMLALERLGPPAHGEKDEEHASKHAGDEDDRDEQIFCVHARLRLGRNPDCFSRGPRHAYFAWWGGSETIYLTPRSNPLDDGD